MNATQAMAGADVLVVGAGPVGLTLAAELARHGVRPRIVERLTTPTPYCRAIGVTTRTLEVWDDMGIARDMIDSGVWIEGLRSIFDGHVSDSRLDLSDLTYASLGLPQYETERLLAHHLAKFGVTVERGATLESFTQDADGVSAMLATDDGGREQASFQYVVGCDGAHSTVRHALGIAFEGDAFPAEFNLGDVQIAWNVPRGLALFAVRPIPDGPPDMFIAVPLPEPNRYRVSMAAPPEWDGAASGVEHGLQSERPAPGIEYLQAAADRLLPEKAVLSDLRWSSLFRISMRLAASYRRGRAFIAGDAAHIHPPTGGQGMNTGIQDAYNLAWKLALAVRGAAAAPLLDSYEAERRPVGADVVRRTTEASLHLGREKRENARFEDAQVLISYRDSPAVENGALNADALGPRAGDRAIDCGGLRRYGVGFPTRFFDLLRGTEHVLAAYCPGADPQSSIDALANFVAELGLGGLLRWAAIIDPEAAHATYRPNVYRDAERGFQAIYGAQPTAMLIRPDGHLAWRGDACRDAALPRTLERTFRRFSPFEQEQKH